MMTKQLQGVVKGYSVQKRDEYTRHPFNNQPSLGGELFVKRGLNLLNSAVHVLNRAVHSALKMCKIFACGERWYEGF